MASIMRISLALVACLVLVSSAHAEMRKRSIGAGASNQDQEKKKDQQPAWKPVTGTRQFSVNVDDNIQGANQHREEIWKNGSVTGAYAAPGRNGKWLKYEYVGDANGFRITSTKEVTSDELMQGQPAADHQAKVNIKTNDDTPIQYTITEDQLKSKDKQKPKQEQSSENL